MKIQTQYEATTIRLAQGKRVVWLDLDCRNFYYQYDGVVKYKNNLPLQRLHKFCFKHNINIFRGAWLLLEYMTVKISSQENN